MKKVLCLCLAFVLLLSLAACSVSKDELIGSWAGSWTYNGNDFMEAFSLERDGTYASVMYKNGNYYEEEYGTYVIDGNEVELHPYGESSWVSYEYKGGKLINNNHIFIKQ